MIKDLQTKSEATIKSINNRIKRRVDMVKRFLTKSRVSTAVEELVTGRDMTYMDAAITFCGDHDIEEEVISKYLNDSIKKKIEGEASSLNFLKSKAQLKKEKSKKKKESK